MVQWLRLYASSVGGVGLIFNQETKISHAVWCNQKVKKKKKKKEKGREKEYMGKKRKRKYLLSSHSA